MTHDAVRLRPQCAIRVGRSTPILGVMAFSRIRRLLRDILVVVCVTAIVAMAAPIVLADSDTGEAAFQGESIVGEWRGAYLPHGWIATPRPRHQISEAVRDLDRMKVNTQIHNIGALDASGSVPAGTYSGLSHWIDVSRHVEPAQEVVLWVSGDTVVHVQDHDLHGSMAVWLDSVVGSVDADGVLLDFEPFRPDDPDLVPLIETIRSHLPDIWIGLVAPSDGRWSSGYITVLSSITDGISPLLYDTSLTEVSQYRNRVATQVARYQRAAGTRALVVPSLPSYAANPWHDPSVENIEEALRALGTLETSLDGAAVYWWWEFTEESRQSWLRGVAPPGGKFSDDNGHLFEGAIEAIAARRITQGCNPPANDRFCPDDFVTRGQMAAFLVRAHGLADDGGGNLYIDDDDSVFELAIDRLGSAGITQGCNPPINDRFCPDSFVTRGQMAAFLSRAPRSQPR